MSIMTDIKKTRISIIGAGALGGAVARGLAKAGCRVLASDAHPERLRQVREDGVELISDNDRAVAEGEVIMFALKPHLTAGVAAEYAGQLKGRLCVSLAAAVTLDMLKSAAPDARWARAMTNICAALNCAFTGLVKSRDVTETDIVWLRETFALLGLIQEVEERNMDALTALVGSAPAFFLLLMEAAAAGGIQAGLPADTAYKGAAAVLTGAARLALETGKHSAALREEICTPGGMTIDGVYELERAGVRAALMKAISSTAEKGKILTDKIQNEQSRHVGHAPETETSRLTPRP